MEQPEYMKMPRGLARQSETPEAKLRRLSARAPRKAICIPAAGYRNKLYENSLFQKQPIDYLHIFILEYVFFCTFLR